MTFMMFLSHGTQDLYPDFLGTVHNFGPAMQSYMAIHLQRRRNHRSDRLRAILGAGWGGDAP